MRAYKSFTTIELVITISIIAVLIWVAVPNISSYLDTKLNVCAEKIYSDIRYTQYLSIAEHKTYGIQFDSANNYYRVYDPATGDTAKDPYSNKNMELDLDNSPEYSGIGITSVNIDSGNEVRFTSLGKPLNYLGNDLVNTGRITLSYRGRTKQILVYALTGWTEIQ